MINERERHGGRISGWLRNDAGVAGVIAFFFTVGVVGHALYPALMVRLTPPVLWFYGLLTAALAILGSHSSRAGRGSVRPRFLAWVVITYLVTFALEAIGTETGAVFGPYTYGDVLGLSVIGVPLVIGLNWVLVVLGGLRVVQKLPAWAAVPAAGVLTTAFDFLMEPIAVGLGYWTWHWDGIPPQNYLAWFVISSAAAAVYRSLGIEFRSRLPAYYLAIQAAFFLALRFVLGLR